MSTVTIKTQTVNQLHVDYDLAKLLLGQNEHKFVDGDVTASGADVEILQGLAIARVGATNKLKPFDSTVVDGSEYLVGIALQTETVADGTTKNIRIVTGGGINENLINFAGAETLATLAGVTGAKQTIADIMSNLGIQVIPVTDLTEFDNA